jgi:asparagine synthetase B (glutamine-hydrolysing)
MQIKALHQYDCQRANKSTFAWGLEARVPFLDKEFINVAMNIDPENKMVWVNNEIRSVKVEPVESTRVRTLTEKT